MIMTSGPEIWLKRDYKSKETNIKPVIQNLTVEVRTIIGILWSCKQPSTKAIAKAIHKPMRYTHRLIEILLNSEEQAVVDALNGEFPAEACVDLLSASRRLRCKTCHQVLSKVPCCRCLLEAGAFCTKEEELLEFEIPVAPFATNCQPGSMSKLMVMRRRFQKGYSLFAPGDPFLRDDRLSDGTLKERYWM